MFCPFVTLSVFTDSALWGRSVIELPCLFVCLCGIKVVIVNDRQNVVKLNVFLYKIEQLNMVQGILSIEGYHNCMICSKLTILTKILSIYFILGATDPKVIIFTRVLLPRSSSLLKKKLLKSSIKKLYKVPNMQTKYLKSFQKCRQV